MLYVTHNQFCTSKSDHLPLASCPARQPHYCHSSLHLGHRRAQGWECGPSHQTMCLSPLQELAADTHLLELIQLLTRAASRETWPITQNTVAIRMPRKCFKLYKTINLCRCGALSLILKEREWLGDICKVGARRTYEAKRDDDLKSVYNAPVGQYRRWHVHRQRRVADCEPTQWSVAVTGR
jgi:hypothetical protein